MRQPTFRHVTGFSLLEVFLALGLALLLGGMAIERIKRDNESAQARAVGEQLNAVGNALNSYIAMRFNQITAGTSVAGAGTADDPGPRTCASSGTTWCWITSDTLRRNGLLPLSFTGRNAYGADYNYIIRVGGVSPSWTVDGIALTNAPYMVGNTSPRYDLLGEAMLAAGADAGMTRTSPSMFEGLNGGWQDTGFGAMMSAMTTNPGQTVASGLIGMRAGFGSAGYAAYLRTDGGNNMTGNLNLGTHDITNAANITASANVQGATLIGKGGSGLANLVLGDPTLLGNTTNFQQSSGALTINNMGGVTFQGSSGLGNVAAGSVMLGSGSSPTTGLAASGTTVTVVNNGSFATTGTGNITAGGTLNSVGNTVVGGQLQISGSATTGGACATSGALARDGGQLVQCKSALWTPLGAGNSVVVTGSYSCTAGAAVAATCPSTNYRVQGGGYSLVGAAGNYYPPDVSRPDTFGSLQGWSIRLNSTNAGCYQVYAICTP